MNNKKALVLLNMGGPRNKVELKVFLKNMFSDKNILGIRFKFLREFIAFIIIKLRLKSAWEKYKRIGQRSPINYLTTRLVGKLNEEYRDMDVYQAMRYTSPFSSEVIKKLKKTAIKEVILFPLYPQYSITTIKSSIEDFEKNANGEFDIKVVKPFYKNELYNDCIVNDIEKCVDDFSEYNLIFSAHSLPEKIIKKGDPYKDQIIEHVEILKNKLLEKNINFKTVKIAYQSRVGVGKWLEPSLDDTIEKCSKEKVLIYPISFIIDNFETKYELNIEYKEFSEIFEIKDFKVCPCLNYNKEFVLAIKDIIKETSE